MTATSRRSPLTILAFDAADAGLLEQWSEQGYLPTLKGLLDRGIHCRLRGQEFVSENGLWVSLFSGLSRGQHGYYYWRPLKLGTYELELSDQRVPSAVPFWGLPSSQPLRAAIVDVPELHCTENVPGVHVANWAPHNSRFAGYSVPASLFGDLRRRFGAPLGFEERVGCTVDEDKRIFEGLLKQIEQKLAICRELLSRDRYDVVVIGFHESHIAGHQFWKYSDGAHAPPSNGGRLAQATRDVYQAIDRAFGVLLEQLGEDTTVIVLSNMGVQEDYPNMELTRSFCRELGYHRLSPSAGSQAAGPRLLRRLIPNTWQKAISDRLPDRFHGRMLTREWYGGTDWSSTTVFPIPSYFLGFLRVNLRGREPHGIVEPGRAYRLLLDRLEQDLRALIDPESGQPAVRYIARTADLYGDSAHAALPDLFFDWAPTPYPKRRILHPDGVLEQKDLFFNRDTRHDLKGFFAAAGPHISGRGRIRDLAILDVAPTCLHLLGAPIPDSMHGTVSTELGC